MTTLQTNLLEATKDLPPQYVQKVIAFAQLLKNKSNKQNPVQPSSSDIIHPEIVKLSGILPSGIDFTSQRYEHLYVKHQ